MTGPLLPRNSQAGMHAHTGLVAAPLPTHDEPGEAFHRWAVRWPESPGRREDTYAEREDAEFDALECHGVLVHRRIEWGVQFDNGHVMVCLNKADAIERCRSASLYGRGQHLLVWHIVREDPWAGAR